jgi:iron complex transport system ATP-binding protein
MMANRNILTARNLSIGYERKAPLHTGLSFDLPGGELTCLLGANGTGKSTLLRTLSASQASLGGTLELLGKPLESYTERERSRSIGVVLTDRTQVGGLTVYELVSLGRQPYTGFFGKLTSEDRSIVNKALLDVGIVYKAQSYVAELSDGERQKAMIAKALVQECPLILLDEPTAFLDVVSRIEILKLLKRIAAKDGKGILLSTHDVEQALVLADRLWLLTPDGGLLTGTTEDLILSGTLNHLFRSTDMRVEIDGKRIMLYRERSLSATLADTDY